MGLDAVGLHVPLASELYDEAILLREADPEGALERFRKAASLFASLGDGVGRGLALLELSRLRAPEDLPEAQRYAERAVDCLRDAPEPRAKAEYWAAEVALARDDEALAQRHLESAAEFLPRRERRRAYELLGQLAFDAGSFDSAERHWMRAWREADDVVYAARLRERFAELALARNKPIEARAQLAAAVGSLRGLEQNTPRLLAARLRTELADLDAGAQRHQAAQRGYQAAIRCYRELGLDNRAHRLQRRLANLTPNEG